MKKTIGIIVSTFIFLSLSAQTIYQDGIAREINSKRKPLGGVFIKFENAPSAVSGDDGKFQLAFKNQKVGNLAFLEEIKKSGYELVNRKDFDATKISNTNLLGIDVILAAIGYVDAAKKEYYGVSDRALLAGFEKEKKALRKQLNAAQLNQKEYLIQLQSLQEQYDWQKESLDVLAEKFARINFDDVDGLYKEALLLFKSGNIKGCKLKLINADLIGRTDRILAKKDTLEGLIQQMDNDLKDAIQPIQLQAETHVLDFEFNEAEKLYDQLLKIDTTNLEILNQVADFYREQHLYKKAINIYNKITSHPKAELWQIANAYGYKGDLQQITGNSSNAFDSYNLYLKKYNTLTKSDTSNSNYLDQLGIANSKLGKLYIALGNLDSALYYFQQNFRLKNQLFHLYPENASFKNGLAIAYETLGETIYAMKDIDSALIYLHRSFELKKQLRKDYPQDIDYKKGLAINYDALSLTHAAIGYRDSTSINKDSALYFAKLSTELRKELFEEFPENVDFKKNYAAGYDKLGLVYSLLNQLDSALFSYQESLKLKEQLSKKYPLNFNFKEGMGRAQVNIATIYVTKQNINKANEYLISAENIFQELTQDSPENQIYPRLLEVVQNYSKSINK